MPYIKITQPKLADAIVAELESMILEGSLQPGQKLPPERELAIQFQVSRPSLREAIQRLEARGLLYRRQGGGTYVQNALSKGIADPCSNCSALTRKPSTTCWSFVTRWKASVPTMRRCGAPRLISNGFAWRKPPSKKPVSKGRWWSNRPP